MAKSGALGRIIVLLLLIILLSLGGILWFDYLGIVQTRHIFAPLYNLLGLQARTGITTLPQDAGNLDEDRIAKRLESIELRNKELDVRDSDLLKKEKEILQMSQELEDRTASVDERERSFTEMLKLRDDREANIIKISEYINGMPPQNAVNNLLAMDDQDIIDILRKVEEAATKAGSTSSVAYWFSLMPPARAAEIQRKMANKPVSIQ